MLARMQGYLRGARSGDVPISQDQVRQCLVATATPFFALRRAASLLSEAAERYEALGGYTLASLIQQKVQRVIRREEEHVTGLTRELIQGLSQAFLGAHQELAEALA
jgi:hypothetical protein